MPFMGIRPVCVTCGDYIVNFQRRTIKRCPPCRKVWDRERRRLNSLAHYYRNRERKLEYARDHYRRNRRKEATR